MKHLSILAFATLLLISCSTEITEQDYKETLVSHLQSEGTAVTPESITLSNQRVITVNDSIDYLSYTLANEYYRTLDEKQLAWKLKQADCEQDEKANILRHEDYMKKYNDAKRKYGNDIKYKNKIDGYLKAAEKLPSNHEEYLDFDRRRSYSFTRDAENLKAEYEEFMQLGVANWVAQHPLVTSYDERQKDETVACAYDVTYTTTAGESISTSYVFRNNPLEVAEELNNETVNIFNYKQALKATESTENAEKEE